MILFFLRACEEVELSCFFFFFFEPESSLPHLLFELMLLSL